MPDSIILIAKLLRSKNSIQEFTLPSLKEDGASNKGRRELAQYRWRNWNERYCTYLYQCGIFIYIVNLCCSFHPYLFFNQDQDSLTFVGFYINSRGDAIDPATSRIIEEQIMSKELQEALKQNRINLSEDYRKWNR